MVCWSVSTELLVVSRLSCIKTKLSSGPDSLIWISVGASWSYMFLDNVAYISIRPPYYINSHPSVNCYWRYITFCYRATCRPGNVYSLPLFDIWRPFYAFKRICLTSHNQNTWSTQLNDFIRSYVNTQDHIGVNTGDGALISSATCKYSAGTIWQTPAQAAVTKYLKCWENKQDFKRDIFSWQCLEDFSFHLCFCVQNRAIQWCLYRCVRFISNSSVSVDTAAQCSQLLLSLAMTE